MPKINNVTVETVELDDEGESIVIRFPNTSETIEVYGDGFVEHWKSDPETGQAFNNKTVYLLS